GARDLLVVEGLATRERVRLADVPWLGQRRGGHGRNVARVDVRDLRIRSRDVDRAGRADVREQRAPAEHLHEEVRAEMGEADPGVLEVALDLPEGPAVEHLHTHPPTLDDVPPALPLHPAAERGAEPARRLAPR